MGWIKRLPFHHLYFAGTILIVTGLPLSRFLMSVGIIWLSSTWVLEGEYKRKLQTFINNKPAVIFSSLYLLHLVGLLYSSDFSYASHDLKVKAPILLYPLLFSTMPRWSPSRINIMWFLFIAACFGNTLCSYYSMLSVESEVLMNGDIREHVQFISHIRVSLFVALSIFMLGYFAVKHAWKWKLLEVGLILWFLAFLWIIESPTGFLVILVGAVCVFAYFIWKSKNWTLRLAGIVLFIGVPLGAVLFVNSVLEDYFHVVDDVSQLETHTLGGEQYAHQPQKKQVENGHLVWINIAWGELGRAWNQRSSIAYGDLDAKGQEVHSTLIRYLTSKGLKKDSVGVYTLTAQDIANVEAGITNEEAQSKRGLIRRIEEIGFEFDIYREGGNPSGNSVTQKLEIWRTAIEIIRNNFWIGVGTGDVQNAFDQQYDDMDSVLLESSRLRGHNQFLTIFVTFGIVGLLWFFFVIFYPVWKNRKLIDYGYIMFLITVLLSFLSEDTIETQAGVTFFGLFTALLLFGRDVLEEEQSSTSE